MTSPSPLRLPQIDAKAAPTLKHPAAEPFYVEAIGQLAASGIPFLLAGTYAVSAYTGIVRETKDLDVFCKAGDYPRILAHFQDLGYAVAIEDDRWLGKVLKGDHFFDVIFASPSGATPVTEAWFAHARQLDLFGTTVRIIGPTELVWSKSFIQLRHRYDGADVAHTILRAHEQIDWARLLAYMEQHWELLLTHLLNFRWIYPTERDVVPAWLLDELLDRLDKQRRLPPPQMKICRGRMLSRIDYEIDVKDWGYADLGGEGGWRDETEGPDRDG
ncbi:nucleotidyltransferase family protein [Methylobacterium isbiliense]|jgi:hypothetical protein|uniref:Nucleotidyltransferase family protein n=1 Tax=Methylobacterium isbiliense TaxID=315478 RepID=A0ABQ4SCZ6_9HYPH|nr:nucleotidyltransferase family protein [Methylobacterium isbiliense]MDN3623845.1 nucleotidyltransferase family protein [Methylobacterium isbiliense]GJE01092.1 hypothetical protein GMJLKIPL_3021 [Methylobacterium isbiliense]